MRKGQLTFVDVCFTHMAGGTFDGPRLLDEYERGYEQAILEGYDGLRGIGNS